MMSQGDSDSGLSFSIDGSHCGGLVGPKIEVKIPDLNIKRIISVSTVETIGMLKKQLINSLSSDLKDTMNFGLFIPPTAGKAGKFLLEERTLNEYGLHQDNSSIELRYKRRLYRTANINVTRLKKLHSKANLKTFMEYVGAGDISKIIKMLNKGLDPNYQLKDTGETPLIRACSLAKPVDVIKALVEGGAHLDFRHSNGHTPLHAAAILGNLDAVKIILDLGQSPNTVDLEGLTPLYHCTISNTAVSCAERLLFDYSMLGIEDENGLQEIHQACRFGRVQHLELLLQYKADINSQTSKNGNTPLHICAYLNQESCARLLLFRGADRTITNRSGHTPYHQALLSDNKSLAILIQYYKDEDIVPLKPLAKYNDKRKCSVPAMGLMHRSRSTGGLSDNSQPDIDEDSHLTSHDDSFRDYTRGRTRSIGILPDNLNTTESSSLFSTKRFSRSFNNLDRQTTNTDSLPVEPDQTSNCWAPDWSVDDNTDTVSSVSGGPSKRRTARNSSKKDKNDKSRSQSCNRRSSKGDLATLGDIDTRYLPRMVVLQRNSQGFGFVIRGLKASSGFVFEPTLRNPALQYFEEVEPGSVAARAGILKGDFILEINKQSVVFVSHEETVRLIKASGDILAMKVVTVNKTPFMQRQYNYLDPEANSMDDASDISSILSSEIRSQHNMSTFTRSMTRPSIELSSTIPRQFANIQALPTSTYSSTPNYKKTNQGVTSSIPLTESVNSIVNRVKRPTNTTPVARPESVASIDSFFPMPPPPSNDFCPKETRIEEECFNDPTLKRLSNHSQHLTPFTSAFLNNESRNHTLQVSTGNYLKANTALIQPPPRGCTNTSAGVPTFSCFVPPPTNFAPPPSGFAPPPLCLAPPPPCPAPPPPCPAPPPPCPAPPPPCFAPQPPCPAPPTSCCTLQATKPILKSTKSIINSQNNPSNISAGFEDHLRDAIAKRRQKIDTDQSSLASFDSADDNTKQHVRTTLNSLKQNNQYSRSQSNRWPNAPCPDDRVEPINNDGAVFQRTHSDIFTKNSGNHKTDDNNSRLYLV